MKTKIFLLFILAFFLGYQKVNAQFIVNNDATQDNCNCYTLTPDQNTKSGSVWNTNMISLNQSFDYTFKVFLGSNDSGADGIAFVLQPISTSVGSTGGGLGFGGISPSLGVTIDTYQNADSDDPTYDHIAIQKNGDINHGTANNLVGPVQALTNSADIEDGQFHTLRVTWNATTTTMQAYIDGDLRLSLTNDIVNTIFNGNPNVYWGFTGSTGGEKNLQRFCTQNIADFQLDNTLSSLCGNNASVTFDDQSSSFGNIVEWNWNFGDGASSNQQNPTHTYANPGTYQVQLTVKGNDGCYSDAQEVTVTIHPIDTVQQYLALCENSTYELPDNQIISTPGIYPVTLVSTTTGCDSLVIFNISDAGALPPLPEKAICKNSSTQLEANEALNYVWEPAASLSDPTIKNPIASPTETTTYTVTSQILIGNNLVINGDFENGNINFTSGYNYSTNDPLGGPGHYTIATGVTNGWWGNCNDHTSESNPPISGNMLIADGANGSNGVAAESAIWCQTISVLPNTDYVFSTWLTNSNSTGQTSDLGFFINGNQIDNTLTTPLGACEWNQFYVLWNSGNNTTIDICIREMSGAQPGNDYAIDDIEFYQLCTITQEVTVKVSDIQLTIDETKDIDCFGNNNGKIVYHASNGIGNYTYSINGNPTTNTSVNNLSKGNYTITSKDEIGCEATANFEIKEPTQITTSISIDKIVECANTNTGEATITINEGTPPYSILWNNGETAASATQLTGGNNIATVTDKNGCKVKDSVYLDEIVINLIFPNVISIESTVGNDEFDFEKFAPNFNSCYDYTLSIVNRWGITVFTVKNDKNNPDLDCSNCFKGKTNGGVDLSSGTYFYQLEGDFGESISGFFTLVR